MMDSNFAGSVLSPTPFPYTPPTTALVPNAYHCGNHILQIHWQIHNHTRHWQIHLHLHLKTFRHRQKNLHLHLPKSYAVMQNLRCRWAEDRIVMQNSHWQKNIHLDLHMQMGTF